eukprot:scaffold1.g5591.t1
MDGLAGPSHAAIEGRSGPSPSVPPSSRFAPSAGFLHNGRVALALIPSLGVLASFGGGLVAAALLVGAMGTYILDAMNYKEGAFGAVWLTMGAANLAMVISLVVYSFGQSALTLLILLLAAATLALTGLWATLQFRWIQLQYPSVVMAFEHCLVAGCLPVAATVLTWGAAASAGMAAAPFFLAGLLCLLYYLFALPLPPSFTLRARARRAAVGLGGGGAPAKAEVLQNAGDAATAFLLAAALPAGVYAATHAAVLGEGWVHFWSLLLLGSGPLLFVTCLQDGLWWLGRGGGVDAARRVVLLASLAVFLAALEGRVVFFSFNQYIRLTAPWNYVAVTVAMYSVAAMVLLHFAGVLGDEVETMLLGPALTLSAAVGALAAGTPLWVLPAPLLAAGVLAMFYETRALRDYAIFWVAALATGGWFVWHHFWFLDIYLGGMHLRTVCYLVLAAMAASALVPGLAYAEGRGLAGALLAPALLAQAGLLCVVEEHLYAGDHEDVTYNLHPMYPAFLVVGTSAAAGPPSDHPSRPCLLRLPPALSSLQCAYAAKLVTLALPEAKLVVPTLGLLLAASPPLLLQRGPDLPRRRRLPPWQGLLMAAAVVLAVAAARFALFDIVQRYYSHSADAKRTLLLAAAFGLLLAIMRPPLPLAGGARCPRLPLGLCPRLWNEAHTPEHEEDDVAIWGDGTRRREHWPLWLLVGAVSAGLAAITQGGGAAAGAVALRLGRAAAAAALASGYLALEFFPGQPLLQGVVLASALLCALFLVLLALPVAGGPVAQPALALLWAGAFPVALLLAAGGPLPPLAAEAERLYPDGAGDVDWERRQAVRRARLGAGRARGMGGGVGRRKGGSAVLAVYAAEALLLAFSLKLRVSSALAGMLGPRPRTSLGALSMSVGARLDAAAAFLGQCMPTHVLQPGRGRPPLKGAGGVALQRLAQEGLGWVPTLGNLATLFCFGLCLALDGAVTGGSAAAALLLSPLLLLLSQDPLLLRGLEPPRRYFPPAAALAGQLAGSTAWRLAAGGGLGGLGAWFLLKNVALLAAALPAHVDLLRWLWSGRRASLLRIAALAPLSLLAFEFADLGTLRTLGAAGLAAAAVQAGKAQAAAAAGARVL